jgi:hypothetical protein
MTAEIEAGAAAIRDLFSAEKPFFVGRNGTIEIETLFFWHTRRNIDSPEPYPPNIREQIERNAGIFPSTNESIDAWAKTYAAALGHVDGGAIGWYKPLEGIDNWLMKKYNRGVAFGCPLRSLEP